MFVMRVAGCVTGSEFHFGGGEDPRVQGFGDGRQADGAGDPAVMFERAPKRRLAGDIAGDADSSSIEAGGQNDGGTFGLRQDRFNGEVFGHGFFASGMNHSRRRADFRVGKRRHILLQEIYQPAFALKQGEHQQAGGVQALWRHGRGRGGNWRRWSSGRRRGDGAGHLARELRLAQNPPETGPSQSETAGN